MSKFIQIKPDTDLIIIDDCDAPYNFRKLELPRTKSDDTKRLFNAKLIAARKTNQKSN